MKTIIKINLFIILLLCCSNAYSQVTFQANVTNQQVSGDTIKFDIYLFTTGVSDLYLGNSDFIFTYNSANFSSPLFEYIDGSTSFINSNGKPTAAYDFNIAAGFAPGGNLAVNINQPIFGNQTQFNNSIAKINTAPGTYKLGTFRLTGINNPAGTFGLQWKLLPPGVSTNVQTINTSTPWLSTAATGTYPAPFNTPLPVELSMFTASVEKRNVILNWATVTEENNSGFDVERVIISNSQQNQWTKIGYITGAGNSNEMKSYRYIDNGLTTGKYSYRLKQIDYNGNFKYFNLQSEIEIGVPKQYFLSQNYPNPFNPATKIDYDLPQDSRVSLRIYDISGKEVMNIINNEFQASGYYTMTLNASNLASGVYFYRFIAAGNVSSSNIVLTKKMLLIK